MDKQEMIIGMHAGEYSNHKHVLRTDDNPIDLWRYALTYWVHNKEIIKGIKGIKENILNDKRLCASICGDDNN